jgi:hypothetical protein
LTDHSFLHRETVASNFVYTIMGGVAIQSGRGRNFSCATRAANQNVLTKQNVLPPGLLGGR